MYRLGVGACDFVVLASRARDISGVGFLLVVRRFLQLLFQFVRSSVRTVTIPVFQCLDLSTRSEKLHLQIYMSCQHLAMRSDRHWFYFAIRRITLLYVIDHTTTRYGIIANIVQPRSLHVARLYPGMFCYVLV